MRSNEWDAAIALYAARTLPKNSDPAKLDHTNIGDAVVIRLPNGTEQSAILASIAPDGRANFVWKSGHNRTAGIAAGGEFLRNMVIAIFPPKSSFLVVERNESDKSPVFACGKPFVSIS